MYLKRTRFLICIAVAVALSVCFFIYLSNSNPTVDTFEPEVNIYAVLYDVNDTPIALKYFENKLIFVFSPRGCAICITEQLTEIRRFSANCRKFNIVLLGYFGSSRELMRFKTNNELQGATFYRTKDEVLSNRISSVSSTSYLLKIDNGEAILFRTSTRRQNETYAFLRKYKNQFKQ